MSFVSTVFIDQGNLTVTALSASGLRAADKSGTSDPYCVFTVDGEKVFKTNTYKKQLNPVFKNETFTAPITRRNKAVFSVKIFDWDQIGSNELLAEGDIPIADLESFAAKEVQVPLKGGQITLRLKWEPQLLARVRQGTSLLGSTTRILTGTGGLAGDVVGMGFGAGGKVIHGGTKVVGGGAKMVGGAIGGGIGVIGGGIGAIGRGIGGIGKVGGGHHKSPSNQDPIIVQEQPALTIIPPAGSDQLNHRQSVLSAGSSVSRKSAFEDKNSKCCN